MKTWSISGSFIKCCDQNGKNWVHDVDGVDRFSDFLGYQQNINMWDCVGYPRFVICEWEAYETCSSSITFEDTSYRESYPMFRLCAEPNAINLKLGMIETQSISRNNNFGRIDHWIYQVIYHIQLRLLKHIETVQVQVLRFDMF